MNFLNKSLTGLALCGLVVFAGCSDTRRVIKENNKTAAKYHPNRPRRYKNKPLRIVVKAVLISGFVIAGGVAGAYLTLGGALLTSPWWAPHGFCPCCLMGPMLLGSATGAVTSGVVAIKKSDSWTNIIIGRDKEPEVA